MAQNPLFQSSDDTDDKKSSGYVLPKGKKPVIEPPKGDPHKNAAANVIRQKLATIYADEPNAKQEIAELPNADRPLSKHQKFLDELQKKATSVAEIQTKWHEYYTNLPEDEKHQVWREFYAEQSKHSRYAQFAEKPQGPEKHPNGAIVSKHEVATPSASHKRVRDARSARDIKDSISKKLETNSKADKPHPLKSLFFGIAVGLTVLVIALFGLFNELIVAPFIQPSRNVSATPIILNNDGIAADGTTKVIIPKINVEIPVDYGLTSMSEDVVQKGLENGVVHYPATVRPGEQGNAAFFGHSSNNIFNPGKYKFAFVLLSNLQPGDMFYLTYNKKVYAYKVFDKKVVNPDETWVLNPVEGKTATAALITCDPPGTTLHRLVVWGEQVSPDPTTNAQTTQPQNNTAESQKIIGPSTSLWSRFTNWLF